MFYDCKSFDKPLNDWNVNKVVDMSQMFYNCINFNQPLNYWNVEKVINMSGMFYNCVKFNQPLNDWNISNVLYMNFMFFNCNRFYQPLNKWFKQIENINASSMYESSSRDVDSNIVKTLKKIFSNSPALEQFNNPQLKPTPEPNQNNFSNDLLPSSRRRFIPPPDIREENLIYRPNIPVPKYIIPKSETSTLSDVVPKRFRSIEIHEEAKKSIKFKELNKFLSEKTGKTIPNDLNFQSYIVHIMNKLINTTDEDPYVKELQKNIVEQIRNGRLNWIFKNNQLSSDIINSIFYCLNYVESQSAIFKKKYVSSFTSEYEKYINSDGLLSLIGVIEEFIFALIPACNADEYNDDCMIILLYVVGIDSFIADWFKLHPLDSSGKPKSLPEDTAGRRANLKEYLLEKLPEEEIVVEKAINELVDHTDFANEFFGETTNEETYNGEVSIAYPIQEANNNQTVEEPRTRARFVNDSLGGTRRRRSNKCKTKKYKTKKYKTKKYKTKKYKTNKTKIKQNKTK
jgi:surface protein